MGMCLTATIYADLPVHLRGPEGGDLHGAPSWPQSPRWHGLGACESGLRNQAGRACLVQENQRQVEVDGLHTYRVRLGSQRGCRRKEKERVGDETGGRLYNWAKGRRQAENGKRSAGALILYGRFVSSLGQLLVHSLAFTYFRQSILQGNM